MMTRQSIRLVTHPMLWLFWAFAFGLPGGLFAVLVYLAARPPRAMYRSLR